MLSLEAHKDSVAEGNNAKGGVSKEKDAGDISQFQPINLLKFEGLK